MLARFVGIDVARPDAVTLLDLVDEARFRSSIGTLSAAMRSAILEWLAESAGVVGAMVLGCVEADARAMPCRLGWSVV